MAEQNNVLQLKKLAAKMTGKTLDKIDGTTIADVLDIIQSNYSAGGGGGASVTITSFTLNANGEGGINNGSILMSNGEVIEVNITQIPTITMTAAEGSATKQTIITVTEPALASGNHYRYTTGDIITPAIGEDLTEWIEWDGTSEITATNGTILNIAECDKNNKAVRCGTVKAVAPLF